MEPTERILIWTFGSMTDADLAASQLRSADINCAVTSDDCGGMFPPLGIIKLLVDREVADAARDILRQAAVGSELVTEAGETANTPVVSGTPPRVYRFNSGLIVGLILGALLHYSYRHYLDSRDRTDRYDHDADGISEEEGIWRKGEVVEWRKDRDGNGRWDLWTYYQHGLPIRDEMDDNFDGKADGWFALSPRSTYVSGQLDTDFNGVPDAFSIYTNNMLKQTDWRPNGTNVVLLRQLFRHGVLEEELRDVNGDGLFDVSILFDRFSTPIRTNSLRPTTESP